MYVKLSNYICLQMPAETFICLYVSNMPGALISHPGSSCWEISVVV